MTPPTVAPPGRSKLLQRSWAWWFMVAVLVLVAAVRLRLLNLPLERDEGEYAYAGQLLLQGVPPYELAYNMKFPGTYAGYAAIMFLFGETPAGIHFGILLLTTATSLLLFWLGKKILDDTAGIAAAASYAVLAACPSMLGFAGHATHFCAFFAAAGLGAMWQARQKENHFWTAAAGVLFGAAVLMKQHAALLALWSAAAWTVWCLRQGGISIGRRLAALLIFGAGIILPFGLCCLWLWHAGVFGKFRFWTIDYARQYASVVPLNYAPALFWKSFLWVTAPGVWLWLMAAAGLVFLWLDRRLQTSRWWFLGFCLASALAVCPDFYFRKHYFLIALPAVALLGGTAVSAVNRRFAPGRWPVLILVLAIVGTVAANRELWFRLSPLQATAAVYGDDPFGEAEIIAKYIELNSPPGARLAVIGSEPEIYFLARRHSATGYIYTYALMEPQPFARKMQDEMIGEIEAVRPEFVLFTNNPFSWARQPDSDPHIFDWWQNYQTNYLRVALADVVSHANTQFRFGAENAASYGKLRGFGLEVFQRK